MIKVKEASNEDAILSPYKARIAAKRNILTFPQRAAEIALNEYLKLTYNVGLIPMCLKIWSKVRFFTNNSKDLVMSLDDKELCQIALLITYGNRELRGSDILKKAFE